MPAGDTTTRVMQAPIDDVELAERIALFAVVTRHPRAVSVLEGLVKPAAAAARKLVDGAAAWPSGKRQARASLEFGPRTDQYERLARTIGEAHPLLRLAMGAQLSPQQQARFPHLVKREHELLAGRDTFAARLIREATR